MKKILIPGWSLGDSSFGVTKPYLEYFSQFGQVEILTPRKEMVDCDLLVLPGGLDINSWRYDEVPGFMNTNVDVFKEYFYQQNLPQYVNNQTPIFGICLGFQQLNVFFGGKLTQNIWWDHGYSDPRSELVHQVYEITGYDNQSNRWLFERVESKSKEATHINSLHHQGVGLDQLGTGLKPLLISPDYFVEAFEHETLPISGVQWHPEELMQSYANRMIKKLLNG